MNDEQVRICRCGDKFLATSDEWKCPGCTEQQKQFYKRNPKTKQEWFLYWKKKGKYEKRGAK